METAIGIGSLVGGFLIGRRGDRAPKGELIIGVRRVRPGRLALGLIDNLPLVLALRLGMGVANMVFVIPSQALFQERTPPELMGRVISLRFALVFGGMTIAMALAGVAMTAFHAGPVIFAAGIVSVGGGLAGLLVRAVRDA